MINDVINSIATAEAKADEIIKNSLIESRKIVTLSEEAATKRKQEAIARSKESVKTTLASAVKTADDNYNKSIEKGNIEIAAVKAKASKNIDNAVKFIVEKVCAK